MLIFYITIEIINSAKYWFNILIYLVTVIFNINFPTMYSLD